MNSKHVRFSKTHTDTRAALSLKHHQQWNNIDIITLWTHSSNMQPHVHNNNAVYHQRHVSAYGVVQKADIQPVCSYLVYTPLSVI